MGNPFRPGGIVEPAYFVGRKEEIVRFQQYLKNTCDGNPHHLAILGERGIGKTSLLRYLEYLSKRQKCMVVRIELDPETSSISQLVLQILTELKRSGISYSLIDKSKEGLKDFFQKYNVSVSLGILRAGSKNNHETEAETKVAFRYELEDTWNKVKGEIPAIIVMIDEAEQLEHIKGSLHYLRNTFLRLSENHACYMLGVSGKIGLFRQIKELHSPLSRFFTPMKLGPLGPVEVREAIEKPFAASGRKIERKLTERIVYDSRGHPYIVQTIGYVLFEHEKEEILLSDYEALKPIIMKQLADQLFQDMLDSASPEEQKILRIIGESKNGLEVKEIAKKAGKQSSQIGTPIKRLLELNCIRKIGRGKYELFHNLFGEFILQQKL